MIKGRVLVIDDEKLIRWSLEKSLKQAGYEVQTAESGEQGLGMLDAFCPDAVMLDNKLPGAQGLDVLAQIQERDPRVAVLFMTAFGTIETAVEAMKRGAYDYVNKPFVFDEIALLLERALRYQNLDSEVQQLRSAQSHFGSDELIAESTPMREIIKLVDKISRSEAPTVMITGESGVGKDLIARLIHRRSSRRRRAFVTINCAALTETLLESELFGHEKGAFTDAKSMKSGQFELAAGGTVYLDEIGDLPLSTQVKLLQVIENRTFRRVGGVKDIRINSLIIAATNVNLARAVEEGRFRRDLYYRLNLIPLELPPLRERRNDILPIALFFIKRFNAEFRKRFTGLDEGVKRILSSYDWPGNIRELRNVIERIVILENDELVRVDHLPIELKQLDKRDQINAQPAPSLSVLREFPSGGVSMELVERELVMCALENSNNNQTKAAKMLDITRDTLRYKMKKFGLV